MREGKNKVGTKEIQKKKNNNNNDLSKTCFVICVLFMHLVTCNTGGVILFV